MSNIREKRLEFLQSADNDKNYYIPIEDLDSFLKEPNINLEKYRVNSKKKLTNYEEEFQEDMYAIEYLTIKNRCIDEYNPENNEYFYKGNIFLDNTFYDWKKTNN